MRSPKANKLMVARSYRAILHTENVTDNPYKHLIVIALADEALSSSLAQILP